MKLFEPATLGTISCKNRSIRSATDEYLADNGVVTKELIQLYETLAKNEVGTIITSHFAINSSGWVHPKQVRADLPDNATMFPQMTKTVHKYDTRIILQINHVGAKGKPEVTGVETKSISPTESLSAWTTEELEVLTQDYIHAAVIAQQTGFDGVQIHGAHGYFLSDLLDPSINKRTDNYGGSTEKRFFMIQNIIHGIQTECGKDFPIVIKLNSNDQVNSEAYTNEFLEIAKLCEQAGIVGIEVSGLNYNSLSPEDAPYYLSAAKCLKEHLSIPIALVGGITTQEHVNTTLESGIDFVSACRIFLKQPDFLTTLQH